MKLKLISQNETEHGTSRVFTNVQTNGDHIRSMTDKELAYWYFNEFFCKTPYCRKEECYEDSPCEECLLDWLKEEVSE